MNKAIRTTIQLSGIELEVFRVATNGDDNDYVMSQSQVAHAIEVHRSLVLRFVESKQLEASDSNNFQCCTSIKIEKDWKGQGNRQTIKTVPIKLASEFWAEQAFKGNKIAQALVFACVQEALKRRCDIAFDKPKTTEEYEQENIVDRQSWMDSRSFLKDAHASFTNCCLYNTINAAVAHDLITLAVVGKKAADLREDDLVMGRATVGLNHIVNEEDLIKIAKVKLQFSRYRTGNVKERISKAMNELGYGN